MWINQNGKKNTKDTLTCNFLARNNIGNEGVAGPGPFTFLRCLNATIVLLFLKEKINVQANWFFLFLCPPPSYKLLPAKDFFSLFISSMFILFCFSSCMHVHRILGTCTSTTITYQIKCVKKTRRLQSKSRITRHEFMPELF